MPYRVATVPRNLSRGAHHVRRRQQLDEARTAKHWDWLIRQGVDGLVIAGTSGEFIALENHERLRLFELAKDVNDGRCR